MVLFGEEDLRPGKPELEGADKRSRPGQETVPFGMGATGEVILKFYTGPWSPRHSNRPHSALNPTQPNRAQKVTMKLDGCDKPGGRELQAAWQPSVRYWAMSR